MPRSTGDWRVVGPTGIVHAEGFSTKQNAEDWMEKVHLSDSHTELEETSKIKETLRDVIKAWEVLPEGKYKPEQIEKWLKNDMWPAIEKARKILGEKK